MKRYIAFMILVCASALCADEVVTSPQVSISSLIVDLKYSREHGVKICEIQPVSVSMFRGADYVSGTRGRVADRLVEVLSTLSDRYWFTVPSMCDKSVAAKLLREGHLGFNSIGLLKQDVTFLAFAPVAPSDPADLSTYSGVVYARSTAIKNLTQFRREYPGAVVMDADLWSTVINKANVNQVFRDDPVLNQYRPRSFTYPRKFSKELVKSIHEDVNSDIYVIKPINSTKGRGVIVVSRDSLRGELKKLLKKDPDLRYHKDPSYRFWYYTKAEEFIVEQYAVSDPIRVAHLDNQEYDGTMRVVCVLTLNKGLTEFHFVDSYWKIPAKSLAESGTLTEKHKSAGGAPYFAPVDADIEREAEVQLQVALTHFMRDVLGAPHPAETEELVADQDEAA